MHNKPYQGLNPYSEEDAKLFFGRANQIENIIDRLTISRLTILYGDSGVGKTSVVRAGVAAQLRQQAQENLSRYQVPVHGVVVFPPFDLSWKDEPLPQLKEQIKRDLWELAPNIQSPKPELPFIETLQAWTDLLGGEEGDGELFIILDQFEEYFLYSHLSEEGTFAFEFPRAVTRSRLRVNFLLSMRKDSLAELDFFKGRLLNLLSNRMELKHLDWDSATEAIKQPIYKYYNEEVSPEEPFAIEDEEELVEQILKEVSQNNNHNHSGRIEAPYLQLVMERLWQEEIKEGSHCLRLQTLTILGGAEGIAKRHLNEKKELLSERDMEIAASVFHYLVTPSGGKMAYSAFDLAELVNQARRKGDRTKLLTESELNLWLDKLTQKEFRLLRPVGKRPNLNYEIFHDVLAQPILDWLAEYWKEKEEKRAKLEAKQITQEAEKIAEKEVEEARQEAWQKIQEAQLKVSQAELKAKRWGIGGHIIAVFCLTLGVSGVFWIGRKTEVLSNVGDIRADYQARARNLRVNTTELEKLNREYLPLLVGVGSQLQRQEWILQSFLDSAYSTQKVGLMRLLASILNYVQIPFPEATTISQGEGKPVWAGSFSSNGKLLATGSEDGTIRLWDLQVDKPRATTISQGEGKPVWASSFSSDGKLLATGSEDGTIRLWDLQVDKPRATTISQGEGKPVRSMSFSSNGKLLATGSEDGTIRLWDLQVDKPRAVTISPSEGKPILTMSFSPDGNQLATGSANGKIRLWDLRVDTPQEKIIPRKPQEDSNAVIDMSFNSNGKQLATASANGVVRLWDLENQPNEQSSIIPVISPRECLLTISFDRHGRQIALVSGKREKKNSPGDRGSQCRQEKISLFDRQVKRIYDYSSEQDSQITRIDFSPDGKQLATFSSDGAVKIWPIYTFKELLDKGRTWVCTHSDNYNPQAIEDLSCPNQNNSS